MLAQIKDQQELQHRVGTLASDLTPGQIQWASGYLAGLATSAASAAAAGQQQVEKLTIWYGSETGNGRGVAERLAEAARSAGLAVVLQDLAEVQVRQIARVKLLVLVVSTHGDGEPPADAAALHKLILGDRAPRLENLRFSVFALGDSSYPDFCQTGRELDETLARLGAQRFLDRQEVDVDFEADEARWRPGLIEAVQLLAGSSVQSNPHLQLVPEPASPRFDRRNPFTAEILETAPLTVTPSRKVISHVVLSAGDGALDYQPGDALGLWPTNDPALVDELLELTNLDASTKVERDAQCLSLGDWLGHRLELTQVVRPFVLAMAKRSGSAELARLMEDRQGFQNWVRQWQVIDVLREYPVALDPAALVAMLRGISPRLYSIASSPLAQEGEVHLVVKRLGGKTADGRLRAGVASWQLTGVVNPGDTLPVYIEPNLRFRLPADGDRPIIMIGPGTGVAPFRGFLEHRQALGQRGRNWLFFGDQHRRTDFLYQLEWQRHQKSGLLTRLSVAFSRDQAGRLYVQHRIAEQGKALFEWLEEGAHVYVCGSGQGMASDVHAALRAVVVKHGLFDRDEAEAYLQNLAASGRYQKDVY